MHRRALLGTAAGAAAPVALAAPAVAQPQPEVRWRLASSFPRSLDVLFGTAERISARVAALTENRFRIQAFPAGEIVPPLQVLDAVQAGTLEAGHTAAYYYIGKDPSFAPSPRCPSA
jgi:TRAP-type mannitol/chloroaromatic compound transport system substrate-binding protein